MDKKRVLLVDGSEDFAEAVAEVLREEFQVQICHEGREALQLLETYRPHVMVLDLVLPGNDGLNLLELASQRESSPAVLVATRVCSDNATNTCQRLGAACAMQKPWELGAFKRQVKDLASSLPGMTGARDLRGELTNLLLRLHMPTKLRGYHCCRMAVQELLLDPDQSITKDLYPQVAEMGGWTAAQVERSIRTAIQAAWERRDDALWGQLFPRDPDGLVHRPTNGEFLSRLAEYLRHPEGTLGKEEQK